MSRARHRLTGARHDDTGRRAIDVDIIHQPFYHGFVQWYPAEDTTLYDVKGDLGSVSDYSSLGGGGTGTTSATYVIDQNIHHDLAGTSSENSIHIGSSYTLHSGGIGGSMRDFSWDFNQDDFGESGSTGWLNTPARRAAMVFDSNDWGFPSIDSVGPGTTSGGITSGDTVLDATMYLTAHTVTNHSANSANPNSQVPGSGSPPRPPVGILSKDVTINVNRLCRGASNDGASNGITSGSMIDTSWWAFKGGDTLSSYWGSSGGSSGGSGAGVYGQNTQDIDQTNGTTFTQVSSVGSGRVVSFDVTALVQDAMDSRTGDLRLLFRYNGDVDGSTTAYGHPDGINDDFVYTNWKNTTSYYSKDHPNIEWRPRIDISFKRAILP